ncbi:MAG TPA: hypothetical protein VF395_08905 [Polyangiaceae bacterium]
MTLRVLLVGAYYPAAPPEDAKRLDVEIRIVPGSVRLAVFRAELTGTVHAEGLAHRAPAAGSLRVGLSGTLLSLLFVVVVADDARPLTISFSQSFARVTVRSLTELTGCLTDQRTGTVLGRVRLRFDVWQALGS